MMYVDFAAGGKEYKLRLSVRNMITLEKQLGCNPLSIFGNGDTMPTVSVMVAVLHASLLQLNHGITADDAAEIFDKWLEDGHSLVDFPAVILEIYKVSGIIPDKKEEEAEKN